MKHNDLHPRSATSRVGPGTEPRKDLPPARPWARWVFPCTGALSLLWFLCRVIPKPSRAAYPCVRASFPAAAAFVVWLVGVWGALFSFRKAGRSLRQGRYAVAAAFVAAGLVALAMWWASPFSLLNRALAFTPSEGANNPMGVAKGIYPGRVVWVRDPDATRWDGVTGHWWDDAATDQTAVDNMLSLSLRRLTGAPSDTAAWDALFRYFNSTHGRGSAGYQSGEKIAIKINCNNTSNYGDTDNQADASPHSVLALLRQLVHQAGVPQTMITVYEAPKTSPSRVIPDRIFNKCRAEFPNVIYADCTGAGGHTPIAWQANAISYSVANDCGRDIPTCVTEATYLVNMALLKGHSTAGITLTAKNHYGSINAREHTYIRSRDAGMGAYNPFVDLIGHPHLGGKTLLFMIDGLYGVRSVNDGVDTYGRWNNLFGGHWSASYFVSCDPVAIDSVGLDFLRAEYGSSLGGGASANCDNYLHEAALADNPPSGTYYINQLNGQRLPSLGVHEHWNNAVEKLYSRNLGGTNGIELVRVEAPTLHRVLVPDGAVWKYRDTGTNLGTAWQTPEFDDAYWAAGPAPLGYGDANGLLPRTTNSWGTNANNKFVTTYYRHTFTVTNADLFTNLNLSIQRDDGAVIYLNGTEVFRSNMTNEPVNYRTFSFSTVSGSAESAWYSTNVPPWLLTNGVNHLAAEVHQCNLTSSDLFFDLTLTGTGRPPPPALDWGRAPGGLDLAWPDTPNELFLQSTPVLPATHWINLTNVPAAANGQLRLHLEPTNVQSYFRLKSAR